MRHCVMPYRRRPNEPSNLDVGARRTQECCRPLVLARLVGSGPPPECQPAKIRRSFSSNARSIVASHVVLRYQSAVMVQPPNAHYLTRGGFPLYSSVNAAPGQPGICLTPCSSRRTMRIRRNTALFLAMISSKSLSDWVKPLERR